MGDFGMVVEREDMIRVWSEVGRGRGVKEVEGNAKDRALLTKARSILDMIGLGWPLVQVNLQPERGNSSTPRE
jgi:hypothetical protein